MENQNMEDSSSRPKVSKSEQDNPRSATSDYAGANPSFSPESIANSLTSALEHGDLDRLSQSRRAFKAEKPTPTRATDEWTLPDLEAMLERRNAQRAINEAVISSEGRKVIDSLDAARHRLNTPVFSEWSDRDLLELERLLRRYVDDLSTRAESVRNP